MLELFECVFTAEMSTRLAVLVVLALSVKTTPVFSTKSTSEQALVPHCAERRPGLPPCVSVGLGHSAEAASRIKELVAQACRTYGVQVSTRDRLQTNSRFFAVPDNSAC